MRDIKFRGMGYYSKKIWYEGCYLFEEDTHYITDKKGGYNVVEPETIGQYTGLKDKNGIEIYEGDIVKLCYGIPSTSEMLVIEYVDNEYIADISVSGWWMRNISKYGSSASLCRTYQYDLEVIGSIHSNPELLEVAE